MDVNYNHLKIFESVANFGNVTLASKYLHISQPSISWTIRQLESNLGVTLFDRTPNGMKLTSDGDVLFQYVRQGFDMFDDGIFALNNFREMEKESLEITGNRSLICTFITPEIIPSYLERYPYSEIRIHEGMTNETISRLLSGISDIGILFSPCALTKSLDFRTIRQTDVIFLGGSKFKHLADNILTVEELLQYPLISLSHSQAGRFFWQELFSANGYIVRPKYDVNSTEVMLAFLKANLGIAAMLRESASISLDKENLYEIKTELPMPVRDICLISPFNIKKNVQYFLDLVDKQITQL